MQLGFKFKALALSATALSIGVGGALFAPAAQAQNPVRPNVIDCTSNSQSPIGICANGLGATFAFTYAEAVFSTVFPGTFNYGSRGSSEGRDGLRDGRCDDDTTSGPRINDPCSFFFSDSTLSSGDLTLYWEVDTTTADGDGIRIGAGGLGLGAPAQVPFVGSAVTVSVDNAAGVTDSTVLSAEQVCALFNGTPNAVAGIPASLVGATGVRRSDGSGTTDLFVTALFTQCNAFGPRDVNGDGTIAAGEDLWSYQDANGVWQDRGRGSGTLTQSQCGTNPPAGSPCWPDSFLGRPGNDGVSAGISEGPGARFGYVELAEALQNPNLEKPAIRNRNDGVAYPATAESATTALAGATVTTRNSDNPNTPGVIEGQNCLLDVSAFDPAAGYPYVGVSYALFFGRYTPSGANANATLFSQRGSALRNTFQQLFTNPAVATAAVGAGYVSIDAIGAGGDLAARSFATFNSCVRP